MSKRARCGRLWSCQETEEGQLTPTLRVPVPGGTGYDVVVELGVMGRAADYIAETVAAHRYAVIADSRVAELYGADVVQGLIAAGHGAQLFEFPAGEWNKTREHWNALTDRMLAAGIGRDSAVVAVGGGVTGDLAGFVAATYMRGLPVIQIPTSLLAMLDSSVGGKTGVDTETGKNLVGAFHHPALVLIDPAVLTTLPRVQRTAGLAEGIKTAAILDSELWDWISGSASSLTQGDLDALSELVVRTVRHKMEVVGADPTELGRRVILNFGHTVAHAIESLEGYRVLHGEAVAAGMRVETRLGEILGITEAGTSGRIVALLAECGLDREWETERRHGEIAETMVLDKKSRVSRPHCVFLERVGAVAIHPEGGFTFPLDDEALEVSLAEALRSASEP